LPRIELEKKFDKNGKYLGSIIVDTETLTAAKLKSIREDHEDEQGWKIYREILKKAGYSIE